MPPRPMSAVELPRDGAEGLLSGLSRRIVILCAIAVGCFERFWLLFHVAINSDAAVTGMMAQRILSGRQFVFYPGVVYGGVEPYLIAPFVWLFGSTSMSLQAAPMILAAVAAVLTWRIATRFVSPALAAITGAIVWAFPALDVGAASTVDPEFRGVTLVCGLACLLLALELLDSPKWGLQRAALLGGLAGVGWWSSLEVVYFLVPTAAVLCGALSKRRGIRWSAATPGVMLVSFGVGASPWFANNIHTGFASIQPKSFPGAPSSFFVGFGMRFRLFFKYVLPMQLNLRDPNTGRWVFGGDVTPVLAGLAYVVLVLAIALCLERGGRRAAIGIGCVAFPFLYAISPATWYWKDGRYAIFLGPLLAIVVACGWSEMAMRLHLGSKTRAVAVVAPACALVLSITSFSHLGGAIFDGSGMSLFGGWGNPDAPTQAAITALESRHQTNGYADYWVAYRLDYLSGGRLRLATSGHEPDRWPAINATVRRSRRAVWIFVLPSASREFGGVAGPGNERLVTFISGLQSEKIPYRIWDDGAFAVVSAPKVPGSSSPEMMPTCAEPPAEWHEARDAREWTRSPVTRLSDATRDSRRV